MRKIKRNFGYWGNAVHSSEPGIGLLLLDSAFRPMYANGEAIDLLAYPDERPETTSLDTLLPSKIASDILTDRFRSAEFMSGKRRYRCQAFSVSGPSTTSSDATVVLFARGEHGAINVTQVAEEFHLTERERETVQLLLEGFTNQQIADRMNISPNTVKAFIKLVMIKMKVCSRVAIVAKMLKSLGLR